jgi:hypothetical protein
MCHSEEQGDEESRGTCKNPLEILRSAQNDNRAFSDGY